MLILLTANLGGSDSHFMVITRTLNRNGVKFNVVDIAESHSQHIYSTLRVEWREIELNVFDKM